MSPDKEAKLCADFPELCRDHGGDPRHTPLYYGLCVGDGWEPILRRLLGEVEAHRQALAAHGQGEFLRLAQVKEKFGGLRVYWWGADEVVDLATKGAEEESFRTCEGCGATAGVTTEGGWVKTLCRACRHAPRQATEPIPPVSALNVRLTAHARQGGLPCDRAS